MSLPPAEFNGRRLAAVAAILLGVVILYWPTVASLGSIWLDTIRATYTHGFLIAALSLWLLWRARVALTRGEMAATRVQHALRLLLLLVLALAWLFAYRAGIQIAQQLLLPPLVAAALLALLGRHAARAALIPLALLYFAIPIWDFFNFAALWTTTHAVHFMLSLSGVPVHFDGNQVQIPAGDFEISGGCSGMHYIIVALAVATLLGELRADRWSQRLRWWLIALVLAVLVNWVRVYAVILSGHLSQMQHYLVRESHYGFGWALFSLVLIGLLIVDRRTPFQRVEKPALTAAASVWSPPLAAAALLALGLPALLNALIGMRTYGAIGAAPQVPAFCAPSGDAQQHWRPQQVSPDQEQRASYQCDGVSVQTYAAWYREQRQGKKLGGYDNRLQGDAIVAAQQLQIVDGRQLLELQLSDGPRNALLWVTYRVADREFTSATRAQLWYSLQALRSLRSPASAATAVRAVCGHDCDAARATLLRFAQHGGIP